MNLTGRNLGRTLMVLGGLLMAGSIFLEYSRMRPDYRFLVEPWSILGTEITQGKVISVIGVTLAVLGVVASLKVMRTKIAASVALALFVVAFSVVLAFIVDPKDPVLGTAGALVLAVIASVPLIAMLRQALPDAIPGWIRSVIRLVVFTAAIVGLTIVFRGVFDESVPLWVPMALGFGLLAVGSIVRKPHELAGSRMLLLGAAAAWVTTMAMSASTRIAHQDLLFESLDIRLDVQDIQVTSGMMLAWFGGLLALLGAVSIWAQTRDEINLVVRARHQREAAAESERELAGADY